MKDQRSNEYAALNEQLQDMMHGEDKIGLYMMPAMDDYEFDPDQLAVVDELMDGESEESEVDMDGFFSDVRGNCRQAGDNIKLRPPSVLGDEQRKLYKEMKEINKLAPERNDPAYMEHLCEFWTKHEMEDMEDAKQRKEWLQDAENHAN